MEMFMRICAVIGILTIAALVVLVFWRLVEFIEGQLDLKEAVDVKIKLAVSQAKQDVTRDYLDYYSALQKAVSNVLESLDYNLKDCRSERIEDLERRVHEIEKLAEMTEVRIKSDMEAYDVGN